MRQKDKALTLRFGSKDLPSLGNDVTFIYWARNVINSGLAIFTLEQMLNSPSDRRRSVDRITHESERNDPWLF